jgi:hypothetical protein
MKRVVMGIVDTPAQAELTVERLRAVGFDSGDVSVLFPDRQGARDLAFEHHTKAPEGALAGAGLGSVLGGILGIAAGVGVLVVPGFGALVAAGPLLAALSGMATGGMIAGAIGAVLGARVPEIEAKLYDGKSTLGTILVAVHTETKVAAHRAREVLRSVAATDVSATTEAAVPLASRVTPRVDHARA